MTERISVSAGGQEADGESYIGSVSQDGNLVAFSSEATNLVPGDTNGRIDIFLRDRQAGTLERLPMGLGGAEPNGSSSSPELSPDGRFLVFESSADNLTAGDTNFSTDIFLLDRQSGGLEMISHGIGGAPSNGSSVNPSVSSDGRFVLFTSFASDLVPGDSNNMLDVFLHDRTLQATERISVDSNGVEANNGSFLTLLSVRGRGMSDDGRYVVFSTLADNLVANDVNGVLDVFLRDRVAGTTIRISEDAGGVGGDEVSSDAVISADGNSVFFRSEATNFSSQVTSPFPHLYRFDRSTGAFDIVMVNSDGELPDASFLKATVSGDGSMVAFSTFATNLLDSPAAASGWNVYAHEFSTGVTRLVSVNSNGRPQTANQWVFTYYIALSSQGRYAIFSSKANDLVSGDQNNQPDVFWHDLRIDGPGLDLSPLIAGQNAQFTVDGATPIGDLIIGFSSIGQGPVPTPFGLIHLNKPIQTFAFTADAAGQVNQTVNLPLSLAGASIWVQGVDLTMAYPTTIFHGIVQ